METPTTEPADLPGVDSHASAVTPALHRDPAHDPELMQEVAGAVFAIGSPSVFDAIEPLVRRATDFNSIAVLQLFRDQRPRILLDRPVADPSGWDAYLAGPYLFDPIYRHFIGGADAGVYRLREIAPPDFVESEFFVNCIANHEPQDEIDLLVPTGEGWAFLILLVRLQSVGSFTDAELQALRAIEPLISAVLRKHSAMSSASLEPERARDLVQQKIDTTMAKFGSYFLTSREQGVLRYLLYGYPSSLIGERLGIAESTVKIHRRSIHHKLDISSQAELLALFVQCVAYADPVRGGDPLQAYQTMRVQAGR
jgi:DNA-binding CsgD family transcriptional regulator